jgi:glycosyltransferase involved in cell wall biosynthesis
MKIWILNHVALKPSESGITRHYDLSKVLADKGHKITIFASSFLAYKFSWRNKHKKNYDEDVNGVLFKWLWTLPYKGNGVKRVFNMMSYFVMSLVKGLFTKEKPDVVVGSSVHLFACLAGYFLAKWKKATYIVEIRDLWPRTLIDFGAMSERHPAAIMFGMIEEFVYKRADRIIVTLPGAIDYISEHGASKQIIHYIPNGINPERKNEIQGYSSLEDEIVNIKRQHNNVVMYVGAHGIANSLETMVQSAKGMSPENCAFVFVGDGPEKDHLQRLADGYEHIYFYDGIPKQEVMPTLNLADILLVSMLDSPIYQYGISLNKLNDYLLIGRPILFAGNVHNNIVQSAEAGITVPPENVEETIEGLKKLLLLTQEEKMKISNTSHEYVMKHHDINKLAIQFLEVCELKR